MIYLTALALFVWLFGYANERIGLRHHNYKNYLIIAGSVVALIMGLRTKFTGSSDTYMYMICFDEMKLVDDFGLYYEKNLSETEFLFSETGFYYFVWLLTRVFSDSQMVVFATSVVITYSTCWFLWKNTKDAPTGLLIYVCLGLFTFNMNGMRQAMAMSVCLWAYEAVKKRKLISFALTVLLAMQFHKTAICFLPVYFIPLLKGGKANTFLFFCGMAVYMFAMDWFIETFNAFTGKEYSLDAGADSGGITVVAIYLFVLCLMLIMHESLKNRQRRCEFYCVVLGFTCYVARYFSNQILERISYYFFYFIMLLVPNVLNEMDEKERQIVKAVLGFASVALLVYRVSRGNFNNFGLFFI